MIVLKNQNAPLTRTLRLAGLVGLTFAATLMIGCKEDTPNNSNVCGTNNDLCITRSALIDTGSAIYATNCTGCHGANGEGTRAPNVANSDYVMGSTERLIVTILHGVRDSIRVNGVLWAGGGMQAWETVLTNHEIAGVLTYIRATMNDSLYSGCAPVPSVPSNCTSVVARNGSDVENDTIAVWQVKAVRDTLTPLPAL